MNAKMRTEENKEETTERESLNKCVKGKKKIILKKDKTRLSIKDCKKRKTNKNICRVSDD